MAVRDQSSVLPWLSSTCVLMLMLLPESNEKFWSMYFSRFS